MRVVVAGAGLGGLALAAGLARGGHQVLVLESDPAPGGRSQGHRVHLDRRGLEALRSLLPARASELVEATCGQFAEPRRLAVCTGRLRPLKVVATGPSRVDGRLVSTAADRATLRAILTAVAETAGAEIRWGSAVSGFRDDGELVEVHMATGAPVSADLLVGCDGARSRVAAQRLPQLRVVDSGSGSIVGRTPVSAVSPRLMATLNHGYAVLRGFRTGLGLGLMRFTEPPDRAGAVAGVPLPAVDDYVMWNVGLATRGELEDAGPELLHDNAIRRLRGWHRDVRTLVAAAAPDRTLLAPGLRAERPAGWSPSRITALGDAVHVMPPDRGSGANLALADAARLATALQGMAADDVTLLPAVGASERAMVGQAFAVSAAGAATG